MIDEKVLITKIQRMIVEENSKIIGVPAYDLAAHCKIAALRGVIETINKGVKVG